MERAGTDDLRVLDDRLDRRVAQELLCAALALLLLAGDKTSATGWPATPPSCSLMNATAASAATEPSGNEGMPPSSLTNPIVTGVWLESAAPAVPPVNSP